MSKNEEFRRRAEVLPRLLTYCNGSVANWVPRQIATSGPEKEMLTTADADLLIHRHLGETSRANHSRFVGYIMRQLAGVFAAPAELWEVVGLCHDLDFFVSPLYPHEPT